MIWLCKGAHMLCSVLKLDEEAMCGLKMGLTFPDLSSIRQIQGKIMITVYRIFLAAYTICTQSIVKWHISQLLSSTFTVL